MELHSTDVVLCHGDLLDIHRRELSDLLACQTKEPGRDMEGEVQGWETQGLG